MFNIGLSTYATVRAVFASLPPIIGRSESNAFDDDGLASMKVQEDALTMRVRS